MTNPTPKLQYLINLENLHIKNYHKYMGQTFNPYFIKDDDYYFIYKGNAV